MSENKQNEGLRQRVLRGDTTFGCWLTLGSSPVAEIAGAAGFDWVLIDLEHGSGGESALLTQFQTLAATSATPLVRVESFERQRAGAALDQGAAGIMFPRIENIEDARRATASLRYPPDGVRGIAGGHRAARYGTNLGSYREWATENIVGIAQVETAPVLECLDAIAALDGIDVLFIGPKDLSNALGIFGQFEHPRYVEVLNAVVAACREHGKAAGILLDDTSQFDAMYELGFRFIGCGSDTGFLENGARRTAVALQEQLADRTSKG